MSLLNKINNRKRNITKSSNIINIKKDEDSKISKEDSNSDNSEKSSEKSDDSKDESKDNSEKSSAKEIHDSFDEGSQDSLNEDEEYNKLKDELTTIHNFIYILLFNLICMLIFLN